MAQRVALGKDNGEPLHLINYKAELALQIYSNPEQAPGYRALTATCQHNLNIKVKLLECHNLTLSKLFPLKWNGSFYGRKFWSK